jgi:NhaP-type Na+/H+ or K+/H+ antiporter
LPVPQVQLVSGVLIAVGLLVGLARLTGLPQSALLFAGGLISALVPGLLPPVRTDPEVVLALLLPPLLYAGVVSLSIDLLRHAPFRGLAAGAALVLGTTMAVAAVAGLLLPGLDPVACLLVGVAVSIGDTRLPQETGHHRHLPRALTDAFAGQAVSARLVVVTLYMLARTAIGGPPPGPAAVLARLALDLTIGSALGLAVGLVAVEFRRRVGPATADVAVSVTTPFLAAVLANVAGVSVAVVIVVAALTISARAVDRRTGEAISSPEARLVARHFWSEAGVLLSGGLYFLVGRALPEALAGLGHFGWPRLILAAAVLLALVLVLQFLLALLAAVMPWSPRVPGDDGRPAGPLRVAAAASWAAHRSAIALALVLAVPGVATDGRPFPERDIVLALTALLVVGSGLLQGTMIGCVLGWARLGGAAECDREAELAQAEAAAAQSCAEQVADPETAAAVGRQALVRLRSENAIGDEALREADHTVALRAHAQQSSGPNR